MIHLLHGAAGAPCNWEEFIPLLHREDVSSVDLCNIAGTDLNDSAASLNACASRGDTIIGYSMGGRLALHALLTEGNPWACAVIISAHTGILDADDREERLKVDLEWAHLAASDWSEFLFKWESQPIFGGKPFPWDRSSGSGAQKCVQRCFTNWSLGRQGHLLAELDSIDIPVLWIAGADDHKFSEIAKTAVSRIPQGQLALMPNAGHRCPWDQPESTAAVIRGFLSQ